MTAIVAVLNKHAVAIAADSAVTMGDTHKVVNCGNKIFTLSKYHPISIMTYGNASFMGVPWDIIIKEYRKQLGDKSFPHVDDYMNDFINYLGTKDYFCNETTKHVYLQYIIENFYDINLNIVKSNNNNSITDYSLVNSELLSCMNDNMKGSKCSQFETYTKEEFFEYADSDFEEFYKKDKIINIPDDKKDIFKESFFYYFISNVCTSINTGLGFVGYGNEDIYPSLIPINVSIAIGNRLKYFVNENNIARIDDKGNDAIIAPFAQTDVIQTIIRGIYPYFYQITENVIKNYFEIYKEEIVKYIDKEAGNEELSKSISSIDISSTLKSIIENIQQMTYLQYSQPFIKTIASLDKEDMANMAESFISLTSLVRRMSPHEETVGGPVDVAVISKGDGFIWINRKHYFKPELNKQFFENYYK